MQSNTVSFSRLLLASTLLTSNVFAASKVFAASALLAITTNSAAAATNATPALYAKVPAEGHCEKSAWPNPSTSLNLPLPVWICHIDNTQNEPATSKQQAKPEQANYQLLADALLGSTLPAMAMAQHRNDPKPQHLVAFLGLSPFFGCELTYRPATTTQKAQFQDACTSACWDLTGELITEGMTLPVKPLLRFPYQLLSPQHGQEQKVQLGVLAANVPVTDISFVPDPANAELPVFDRLLKALLWGRLADVQTLWPQLPNQGKLTESEQARLFINAAAKEHLHLLDYLKSQGLDPNAKTEMGGSLLSVAQMMKSDKVLSWLNHE